MFKKLTLIIAVYHILVCSAHGQSITECVDFPINYSSLNIPQTTFNLNGHTIDAVIDLGLKTALSLEQHVLTSITDRPVQLSVRQRSDLTGNQDEVKHGMLPTLLINGKSFQQTAFEVAKPWGLWINSAPDTHPLANNTIGRDLFLKNKGVLYYSRNEKRLRWCQTDNPDFSQYPELILWQPLKEDRDGIHLTLYHQQRQLDFVFDSAASYTLIRPYAWLNLLPNDIAPDDPHLGYLNDVAVQDTKFKTLVYRYDLPNQLAVDGLIGDSFFKHTDLIIDTVNQVIGLKFK